MIVQPREQVSTDANYGQLLGNDFSTSMSDFIANSPAVASVYGGYTYYRIRRAYIKWTPKVTDSNGVSWIQAGAASANVAQLKPRVFKLPLTTSFDPSPSSFTALLEYAQKKELNPYRTMRFVGSCCVEDNLAGAGIIGNAYMPRKCLWIPMSRTQLPIYLCKIFIVKPQRPTGITEDVLCQMWDAELHAHVELKRMKF